jgi:hypothetical protein
MWEVGHGAADARAVARSAPVVLAIDAVLAGGQASHLLVGEDVCTEKDPIVARRRCGVRGTSPGRSV